MPLLWTVPARARMANSLRSLRGGATLHSRRQAVAQLSRGARYKFTHLEQIVFTVLVMILFEALCDFQTLSDHSLSWWFSWPPTFFTLC